MTAENHAGFHGPRCWLLTAAAGILIGAALGFAVPADAGPIVIREWMLIPFGLMLASIATMPFINVHFWEHHFADFAFVLGGLMVGYYFAALGDYGSTMMAHAGLEYFQFIALVGGLYIVSGGVLIDVRGRGRPLVNSALLGTGAVLANFIGTTGASMLLIRPFLRLNRGRIHPFQIALFIMVVSNCGGCLTPIGDPPLFLGYLKGIPFSWTLTHLWGPWLFINAALISVFYVLDSRASVVLDEELPPDEPVRVRIAGYTSVLFLALLVGSVLLDAELKKQFHMEHMPFGAIIQLIIVLIAHRLASREILKHNGFSFGPVKEVAFLFIGIFATMVPALAYLEQNAKQLGLSSPSHFYFYAGTLSAVLDNAPTYLSFLQTAFALVGKELSPANVPDFIGGNFETAPGNFVAGAKLLSAVSLGSVLFGAMTYIGNGPNFMVKGIAETSGARAPSFFGYVLYAVLFLLPILVAAWAIFIR
jgi:Na+/H+ antiporter NhaD/arsenite permease-like protein